MNNTIQFRKLLNFPLFYLRLYVFFISLFVSIALFFQTDFVIAEEDLPYRIMREGMVKAIEADVRETSSWIGTESLKLQVMQSMSKVPRHEFVPENLKPQSYENRPLPIGYGQTISQPYIVALMTHLANVDKDDKVLEVGTGSGYQAAIISELVKQVFTIEIIEALGKQAALRFKRLGNKNITARIGDGYYGWEKQAPFDAILVTAAASHVPPPLIKQLKPGGKMVIPVSSGFFTHQLMLITKKNDGSIITQQILPVRFVPLTGKH